MWGANVIFDSSENLGQKLENKITKLSKTAFCIEFFRADLSQFLIEKLDFWVNDCVFAIKSKHFRDFLKVSFGNLRGSSYIHFLVIIFYLRFTCGGEKLCWKSGKGLQFFAHNCLKNFLLVFTCSNMHFKPYKWSDFSRKK